MAGVTTPTLEFRNIPQSLQPVVIQLDTSGTLVLLAGKAGYTIDVWGMVLSAGGATNIQFESVGSNEIKFTHTVKAGDGPPIWLPPYGGGLLGQTRGYPMFQCNDGEGLTMLSTGGVTMAGTIYLTQRPTSLKF